MAKSKKLRTFLWFNEDSKSVAQHYKRVFKSDFELIKKHHAAGPKAPATSYEFMVLGNHMIAHQGKGEFKFNEAVSFMIACKDQKEINRYWNRILGEGGKAGQCGWIYDKFGVAWQIVPNNLPKLLSHKSPEGTKAIMDAFLKMTKIEIAELKYKAPKPPKEEKQQAAKVKVAKGGNAKAKPAKAQPVAEATK